jgi:hypothetical protein
MPTSHKLEIAIALGATLGAVFLGCGTSREGFGDDSGTFSTDAGAQDRAPPVLADGQACLNVRLDAKPAPLDVFLAVDHSFGTYDAQIHDRWPTMKAGLFAFIDDPKNDGVSVALTLFPTLLGNGMVNADYPGCGYELYYNPAVRLGPLPANAPELHGTLDEAHQGALPAGALDSAAKGTLLQATQAKDVHPDHVVVALVVTTEVPLACPGDGTSAGGLTGIASLAGDAFTYNGVISNFCGVNPGTAAALQPAATNGGGKTFDITATAVGLTDALASIRKRASRCAFKLPDDQGTPVATDLVNVKVGGTLATYSASYEQCSRPGAGWYLDPPSHPKKVMLCPSLCDQVQDAEIPVDILFGCKTVVR